MPYKPGGGDQLQSYDEETGQYDEETKARINEKDKEALALVHYFGIAFDDSPFPFPIFGIHDREYCELFTRYARRLAKGLEVKQQKVLYLLTYNPDGDKSEFLERLGYSQQNPIELISDISDNTEIQTLSFSRFKKGYFLCYAKTVLKGKIVKTIWELHKDYSIHFVTLIPGGDKLWKK